jgi:peptidoglycan hydrolase CwlO-like protein
MVQLQTQLDESKALITDLQAKLAKAEAENALLRKPPAKK